jgi:hypothetical protein
VTGGKCVFFGCISHLWIKGALERKALPRKRKFGLPCLLVLDNVRQTSFHHLINSETSLDLTQFAGKVEALQSLEKLARTHPNLSCPQDPDLQMIIAFAGSGHPVFHLHNTSLAGRRSSGIWRGHHNNFSPLFRSPLLPPSMYFVLSNYRIAIESNCVAMP